MPNIRIIAIFAIIIIGATVGIAWPFISTAKPVYLVPVQASQWHIGKGSEYSPTMTYQVSYNKTQFSTTLQFLNHDQQHQIQIQIHSDIQSSNDITETVDIGNVYDFPNTSTPAKPYVDILDQTLFSMRDYATEEKYLAKDAEWGDLYIGANHEKLKVTDSGKTSFGFGTANAFVLSYRIGPNINKIWIVDNLPIPAKAEIYDTDGSLLYTYELVSLKAPSTPGFTS